MAYCIINSSSPFRTAAVIEQDENIDNPGIGNFTMSSSWLFYFSFIAVDESFCNLFDRSDHKPLNAVVAFQHTKYFSGTYLPIMSYSPHLALSINSLFQLYNLSTLLLYLKYFLFFLYFTYYTISPVLLAESERWI